MAASLTGIFAAFPKPTDMTFSYPKSWGAEETGAFGALADGNFKGAAETQAAQFLEGITPNKAIAAASAKFGHTVNKRNRVIFQDLPFREISLAWELSPRSRKQAEGFIGAIDELKIISAPKLGNAETLWITDDVTFTLEILSTNLVLFKSQALVIRNITINYTPHGFWSQHKDGFPTKISLGIDFTETELLHRDKFGGDFQ